MTGVFMGSTGASHWEAYSRRVQHLWLLRESAGQAESAYWRAIPPIRIGVKRESSPFKVLWLGIQNLIFRFRNCSLGRAQAALYIVFVHFRIIVLFCLHLGTGKLCTSNLKADFLIPMWRVNSGGRRFGCQSRPHLKAKPSHCQHPLLSEG